MAFKLTKEEEKRLDDIYQRAEVAQGRLEDAKSELENEIQRLIDGFNETHLDPFNAIIEEARGFVEDIANERTGEYDEKSERWQEGERGQAAYDWCQTWEQASFELDEIGQVETPAIEFEAPDITGMIDGLPREIDV